MREREPDAHETSSHRAEVDEARWWALRDVDDLSLVLGHGADAPDPADLGEPPPVTDAMRQHVASRLSRRRVLSTGMAGVAAGLLTPMSIGTAAVAPRAAKGRGPWRGDAQALNRAIDTTYLRRVTERVTEFGDTPDGWRPGGSPANLESVEWIAREMRSLGMRNVAKLPVPIDRWVFNGAAVTVDG